MANLIIFIWFSVLLTLAHNQQEVTDSPIENITVDLKTKCLRWTNVKNVTKVSCTVNKLINGIPDFEYKIQAENNNACPISGTHLWCQGVEYVIEGSAGKNFSKTFHFPQRGEKGTTKENVACQIYDANMDCKWTVRKTPRDIQYRFFYSHTPEHFIDTECPKYKKDSEGRHVGCHFDNLSGFKFSGIHYFLVNGTSGGREVQCTDARLRLTNFEILKPPNININCSSSNCFLKWEKPKTISEFEDIEYELCIQKDGEGSEGRNYRKLKNTKYDFKIVGGKYSVKIRARKDENWSEWSEPQEFGHKAINYLTLTLSLLGVLFIVLLIMGYLCKRYQVIQKIFPPIPRIKDQVSDIFQKNVQEVWEEDKMLPEQCKIEEIRVIEKKSNYPSN